MLNSFFAFVIVLLEKISPLALKFSSSSKTSIEDTKGKLLSSLNALVLLKLLINPCFLEKLSYTSFKCFWERLISSSLKSSFCL